ncbi:hypothetical protein GCM10007989_19600 [Devosia pacifica]|uniref:DNA-directed DNA polymerase n=1 Tax=Devosia pacifica TaxID=1335967 RepID=A0A918S4G3_9HYPH|nr:hypothetical protein GCM10007989_19600 [Devosia pacifica]
MVLNLPLWATDCLRRAEPSLSPDLPLVLYEKNKGAMRLVALDALAAHAGLRAEQSLAEARAQLPTVQAREIDRSWTSAVFADFADWHSWASPLVAVLEDMTAYGDLVLDITGVSHLFGGEEAMLERVTGRLAAMGITVFGAIAPSIGAAWAISHHGRESRILAPDEVSAALSGLPVSALRLNGEQVAGLAQMGLKSIGQLYQRPRKPLQARFGVSLLTRLDQALGHVSERMTPRLPPAERFAERRFAEPIGLMDDVLAAAHDLAIRLGHDLEREGVAAHSFHLFIYRVDHKVLSLSVNAGRATRDPSHITRLFAHRSERLEGGYDPGFGIDMIRLAASSVDTLDETQMGVFETRDGASDLDRLYDRMTARLGALAVVRSIFVDTHVPERAIKLAPAVSGETNSVLPNTGLVRPLRLLPSPEPISVVAAVPDGPPAAMVWRRVRYGFVKASGPERIGAEWWRAHRRLDLLAPLDAGKTDRDDKPEQMPLLPNLEPFDSAAATRDYYVAEDDGGRRFWLFRLGLFVPGADPQWYLHGVFS